MANLRQKTLGDIRTEFFPRYEILSLIYNPQSELEKGDLPKIKKFLLGIKKNSGILILNGRGGCANSGRKLALLLRKKFKKGLWIVVPNNVSSALLYTVLISNGLIIGEKSFLTPLDPIFTFKGKQNRATLLFNSKNPILCKKAREHWADTAEFGMKLLNLPYCITCDPKRLNLNALENIARFLFIPKTHETPIFHGAIEKMCFEHVLFEEEHPLWEKVEHLFTKTTLELIDNKKRFILERKNDYKIY